MTQLTRDVQSDLIKGTNAAMAINDERTASVTVMALRSDVWRRDATASMTLMISCTAKNAKTPPAAPFQLAASSNLPLRISENACERPHEGHGSPVMIS